MVILGSFIMHMHSDVAPKSKYSTRLNVTQNYEVLESEIMYDLDVVLEKEHIILRVEYEKKMLVLQE